MGQRILVYRIGSIGDTVVTLPAFYAIRQNFPNAFIALLNNAPANAKNVMSQSILPSEMFDDWLLYPFSEESGTSIKEYSKLLIKLRQMKFDTLVYLAPRLRTGKQLKRDLLFFRLAGIKTFIGHKGLPVHLPQRNGGNPLPSVEHEADHLLRRLKLSGLHVPSAGEGSIDLQITESEFEQAKKWLEATCNEALKENRLVGVAPNSKLASKVWQEERFAELGKQLIDELNLYPITFGGREDYDCGERLIKIWGRGANAAGKFGVRFDAAVLALCRLFVGNDTGTMHLAAAVRTPCVGIFSAHLYPGSWYPYGKGHKVLRETVPCEGCMLKVCDKENLCLTLIGVDKVFEACKEILGERAVEK